MTKSTARGLFYVWISIIVGIVVPWGRFVDHSHWIRVEWLPFVSESIRVRDILANALLYVPLGFWHRKFSGGSVKRVALYALALSIGSELTQVFSHGRFPSMTDVVCNTAGAACGSLWAKRSRSATGLFDPA